MFSRILPSWEQIERFKQPLTEGEVHLLKFLDAYLKQDDTFQGNDLAKYNGWLIFVQPFLNGSRPDIVILNPHIGVQIFEVKDWYLRHYFFESQGIFCVRDSRGAHTIKSPIKQVEYYKEKIIGQLIPQIGESFDENIRQYGLIKTALYFHKATTAQVQDLFQSQRHNFIKFPLIGRDTLLKENIRTIVPDHYLNQSKYWQRDWNKELLFWLNPPFHAIEQNTYLTLTNDQKKFSEPLSGHYRVRGVAGSGKTQVLAYRAAKLASQGYHVLVLTFNITLLHVIHDMVQRSPFTFHWENLIITYFHGFCKDILNKFGEKWPTSGNMFNEIDEEGPIDEEEKEAMFREIVANKVLEIISQHSYEKYDAILIDEGQDFCIEWYSMLCHFLTDRDEVVVVCAKKQNIYKRSMEWLDKRRRGVEKFGDWIELKKIMRLPAQVARISVEFSETFNLNRDIRIGRIEKPDLFNQFQDHVVWWNIGYGWLDKVEEAFEILKSQAMHNHPSDMVILLPNNRYGFECVSRFDLKKHILINHVFENNDDKRTHKHKKAFWMGDSRLKMSTIHSFKGWEVPNVIVVIPSSIPGEEKVYDSIIYTAITRSRENLIIVNTNTRYWEFGESLPNQWME